MNNIDIKKIVENLIETFLYAGKISIELRNQGLTKKIKSDNTPVSNGDLEVNKIITKKIVSLTPDILIISEETSENKSKNNLENFWLIDPIDGTYDYINDLEEFTINAGLIINKKPVAGLIYAPAKERMFYSYGKDNAYEIINGKHLKLDCSKNFDKNIFTKSGIMLGLGETRDEVLQVMDDLRAADVDFLTIGQYLQPSVKHHPLEKYYTPKEFEDFGTIAKAKGFLLVSSTPLTRSSYHADEDFAKLKLNRINNN